MSRLRNAWIAASVGSVATLGLVVLPSLPAAAAPADVVIEYSCVPGGAPSSIVRNPPVRLTTNLTFATDVAVGEPLNFTWKMNYTGDGSRLQSPGYFGPGGQVHAIGNLQLGKDWTGILQPKGAAESEEGLRPDDELGLPESMNDPGLAHKPGTVSITAKDIELDFTPPDGDVLINDGDDADNPSDMKIVYGPGWTSLDDRPSSENHVHNDLHQTNVQNASAELTFVGTQVTYIGPTDKDSGPVDIYIDGNKRATIDPSRDADDDPVNDDLNGGQELWKSPTLTYGEHKIRIVNVSNNPAKYVWLDAFEVTTTTGQTPTGYHSAKCTPLYPPNPIWVTIREKSGPTDTNSPDPTDTSTDDPGPDPDPDPDPDPGPQDTPPQAGTVTDSLGRVIVVPQVSGTTTVTPKSTGPTATKYYRAQVGKTPSGGVDSGEAPETEERPYGLMAAGMVVAMGSAGSGLLLRRRKAAHAGGAL